MSSSIQVGVLGGGQLAMMLAEAAEKLGLPLGVYEEDPAAPAFHTRTARVQASPRDRDRLRAWLEGLSVLTFENEFVDTGLLRECLPAGLQVFPSLDVLDLVQDKLRQKAFLAEHGFPVPAFGEAADAAAAEAFAAVQGWPIVLKERRHGYDGRGTYVLKDAAELRRFFAGRQGRESLLAEAFVPFTMEIAIQVARNPQGRVTCFPPVKTFQTNGICHWAKAPASLGTEESEALASLARRLMEALQAVGVFAVELFCAPEGGLLINELAPRVHNSGHYTIEGCRTSQFEQHLRAVTGADLGPIDLVHPGMAMINILGDFEGPYRLEGAERVSRKHPAVLHWYHKKTSSRGRKLGHLTAWGDHSDEAMRHALEARKEIHLCPCD